MKEYNIKRHYESEHKGKFDFVTGELKKRKIGNLKASSIGQETSSTLNTFVMNQEGMLVMQWRRPFTDS
jgi:hypothetical protein